MPESESKPLKSDVIQIDTERHIIKINNKFYRLDVDEKDNPVLTEVDPKKYDEMICKIMKNIEGALDTQKLLRYCLNRMPLRELNKIDEKFKTSKKRKPVMRTKDGCIELSVGGVDIPIVD
jgi:hypothetical protein